MTKKFLQLICLILSFVMVAGKLNEEPDGNIVVGNGQQPSDYFRYRFAILLVAYCVLTVPFGFLAFTRKERCWNICVKLKD